MFDNMFHKKKEPKTYILVKEGTTGIESFVEKDITRFNPAYKGQLITFLKQVTKMLETSEQKVEDDERFG